MEIQKINSFTKCNEKIELMEYFRILTSLFSLTYIIIYQSLKNIPYIKLCYRK